MLWTPGVLLCSCMCSCISNILSLHPNLLRGTYKYEHSNVCTLKPETIVPRCASHVGEEKWLVYVQCFDWQTAAMINFRNTFPNFESMRAYSEYM